MENKLLTQINEKLDIVLSLFTIKEDGKEKTLLEKYNEQNKKQYSEYIENYNQNMKRTDYLKDLKEILEDSFSIAGSPPNTDKDGFFEVDGFVYNIKDNQ